MIYAGFWKRMVVSWKQERSVPGDCEAFCVYDRGVRQEGEWFLRIRSVIVFGRIEIIEDPAKTVEISRRLSRKFTADENYIENEIVRSGPGTLLLALVPEHMTGKLVKES